MQPPGFHRPRRVDDVFRPGSVGSGLDLLARMLEPAQRLAAVVDAAEVEPAVAFNIDRQFRVIVEPTADHFYVAQEMLFPFRAGVPGPATGDVELSVLVDIEDSAGAVLGLGIDDVRREPR